MRISARLERELIFGMQRSYADDAFPPKFKPLMNFGVFGARGQAVDHFHLREFYFVHEKRRVHSENASLEYKCREYLCFVPRQILSARNLHCNFYEQVLLFRDLMLAELLITSVAALSLVRPAEPLIMSMDKNSSQEFVSIFDPLRVGVMQSQH